MKKVLLLFVVLGAFLVPSNAMATIDVGLAQATVPGHPWPQNDCNGDWGGTQWGQVYACYLYNVNGEGVGGHGTVVTQINSNSAFVRVYYYKYHWGWGNIIYCHTTVIAYEPFSWQYYTYGIEYRTRSCD